ncbi:hypothetical protein AYI68_g3775 [Smittium mucronatum]|uniref:Uncharacterized protein n=1 Tax=Smittium mucronatum TaxID=133383 RepID=A0A1R0GZ39_9FUNG|nr:hypothetical protein AYI68_g3775 [Smittium mucronatum]
MITIADYKEICQENAVLENDISVLINALASGNKPELITFLVENRLKTAVSSSASNTLFAQRMRESLFKTISLIGTPRTLNAMTSAFKGMDEETKNAISAKPFRDQKMHNYEFMEDRGRSLFNRVYSKHC